MNTIHKQQQQLINHYMNLNMQLMNQKIEALENLKTPKVEKDSELEMGVDN